MQIHYFSDVFIVVVVVIAYAPYYKLVVSHKIHVLVARNKDFLWNST